MGNRDARAVAQAGGKMRHALAALAFLLARFCARFGAIARPAWA